MSERFEAGAELDAAVARACGIEGVIEQLASPSGELSSPRFCISNGSLIEDRYWSPSTDIATARDAAKKAGFAGAALYSGPHAARNISRAIVNLHAKANG